MSRRPVDTRVPVVLGCIYVLVILAIWVAIGIVAWHFLAKWW